MGGYFNVYVRCPEKLLDSFLSVSDATQECKLTFELILPHGLSVLIVETGSAAFYEHMAISLDFMPHCLLLLNAVVLLTLLHSSCLSLEKCHLNT